MWTVKISLNQRFPTAQFKGRSAIIDTVIIDFHTHIFPSWLRDQRERYLEKDATFGALFNHPKAKMATAEELIAAMDEEGANVSVAMGMGWTDQGLAREVNDYIIEATRTYPNRIVGFCSVSPRWGSEAVKEAERCARAGLRGIGELHPDTQDFDLDDEKTMASIIEVARHYNLIMLTHSSEPVGHLYQGKGKTTPDVLCRFIESFPDVTIVCAHWGGGLPFYALMPEVAQALKNVYFDSAASPFLYSPQVFSTVAGLIGPSKILLASDYPLLRQGRLINQVRESLLPDEDKKLILGGNAASLLGL